MIVASTVKISTMADDTLRLVIDIEPRHAQEAFALFGQRGMPCVIARLTQEAATAAQQAETIAGNTDVPVADEKPKGGDLARLAGMLCANPKFREWADVGDAETAASFIRIECGIGSRAELDHNEAAAQAFHRNIRLPFLAWQEGRA